MLEARVGRLEEDMREVKDTLRRLEPMIVELVHTTAKKSDLERVERRLEATRDELHTLNREMGEVRGEMKALLPTRTFVMWIVGLAVALFGMMLRLTGNL